MTSFGETICIDIGRIRSSSELLDLLGDKLELGGPKGNFPVTNSNVFAGWGLNWSALEDSLSCLDSGGIWGTSRIFSFPLNIEFTNSTEYYNSDFVGYKTLSEILEAVALLYEKHGMTFNYSFK